MTTCELTECFRQGDAAALTQVYQQHVTSVWRYACSVLGGRRDAADEVTADTFLAMVAGAGQFDPTRATLEAWLFAIARRKIADHLRAHYRDRRRREQLRQMAWPELTTEQVGQRSVAQSAVQQALAQLPTPQQQVLVWKYCEQLSVARIAQRLGRSDKATENLLYRARVRLRQLLETSPTQARILPTAALTQDR